MSASAHFARTHLHETLARLIDGRLCREMAYVDGQWTASEAANSFEVTDPTRVLPAWRALLPQERAKILLRRWFEPIVAAKDDLALLMTLEQGKPLKESRGEINCAASFVEPVAAVVPFDTEDEVISRSNATEYGLVAYVVTENGARPQRLGRALDYGMVAINRVKITGAPIPFGGVKQSGIGREGSRHGLEAFTDLKYLCLDLG